MRRRLYSLAMTKAQHIKDTCPPCNGKKITIGTKRKAGLFSGILLAFLPKCPFCFMAFSGTAVLCGNGTMVSSRTFYSPAAFYLTITFCVAVLLSIIFNYRDIRTKYALLFAVSGSACLVISVSYGGGLSLYYFGVGMIFLGVWLNASLLFFLHIIRRQFSRSHEMQKQETSVF